jgi:hypothetical protein
LCLRGFLAIAQSFSLECVFYAELQLKDQLGFWSVDAVE